MLEKHIAALVPHLGGAPALRSAIVSAAGCIVAAAGGGSDPSGDAAAARARLVSKARLLDMLQERVGDSNAFTRCVLIK